MSTEKHAERDRSSVYSTGIEVLVAGAIVLTIGIMFQFLGSNVASRISGMTDLSFSMQHIVWIFWVAPLCYMVSAPMLGAGAFLLCRAHQRDHSRDKWQTKLTSYRA